MQQKFEKKAIVACYCIDEPFACHFLKSEFIDNTVQHKKKFKNNFMRFRVTWGR